MNKSLATAPNFVALDLRALALQVPFVPEQLGIDDYTFLPFVRTGLAAALVPPTAGATRATVPVSVTVEDDAGGTELVSRTVTLRGPGDVIGIEAAQIVRRVPTAGARNVEESFVAHVEFDRPELPWLFSPTAVQNNRLQPWLALVVVDAAVSTIEPGPAELPSRLRTRLAELPPLTDAWAWAHAQVVGKKMGTPTVADRLSESHAATNLSRLVCPRRLDANRSYIAALVPTYDVGVQVGLGLAAGTLAPAWTRAANNGDGASEVVLPVYDTWRFSVGPAGDFESLAKKIHGVAAPWTVGRRIIDAGNPRGGLAPLGADEPGRLQLLRCALVSPAAPPPDAPREDANWSDAKRGELRAVLDAPALAPEADDLPRVGPRIYARWQRGQATVDAVGDGHWFPQLNTSPTHRIVAGVGTRVVQKDQEPLMQAAWAQVGEVQAANALLTRVQFGRYVSEAMHKRHLETLGIGELAQVMRGVQDKVRGGGDALTLHGTVRRSATAPAAMTAAFRRATRVRGPVARLVTAEQKAALRAVVGTEASGFTDFRRRYTEPEGVRGLSAAAIAAIPAELLGRKLGVQPRLAATTLARRLDARRGELTVTDRLLSPVASWNVRVGTIDLGKIAAERLFERATTSLPTRFADDAGRAEAVTPLLVGIANASVADFSPRAKSSVERIETRLRPNIGGGITRPPVGGPGGRPPIGVVTRPPIAGGRVDPPLIVTRPGVTPPFSIPAGPQRVPSVGTTAPAAAGIATVLEPARLRDAVNFETGASRDLVAAITATRAVPLQTAAQAFSTLVRDNGALDLPKTPDRPTLALTRRALLDAVAPRATLTAYARSRFTQLPAWLAPGWFDNGRVERIMAAPHFDRAMYEAVDGYDRDWLVPGLGSIAETDFVTVLLTNPTFNEALLVGLSDEMGRELLWRGYPTDQRGTYFRRFWDHDADELAQPIHGFTPTPLGTHMSMGGGEGRVVLVIRGELVQRHPDLIVLAMRAGGSDGEGKPVFVDPASDATAMARTLFHAQLPPDIVLVGFDLTAAQVRNDRWWFVLAEHPAGPRFGLDLGPPPPAPDPMASPVANRNVLDWNDLGALAFSRFLTPAARAVTIPSPGGDPTLIRWPETSAMIAAALLQSPVRAAFDAKKLVGSLLP